MAVKERKIPCPLCETPVFPKYMPKSGICIRCEDERRFFIRDLIKKAEIEEKDREERHHRLLRLSTLIVVKKEKVETAKQELAVLEEERRKLKDIYKAQASIVLAKRSLLHYVERKVGPKYKTSWFHEDVCRRLERFIQEIENGGSPRLILSVGPRLGKSEIVSDCFPAWILGKHPDWNVLISGYNDDLPTSFSRSVRDQLQSDQFKEVFPNGGRLSKDNASAQAWKTVQGGGVRAAGVSGTILGFGGTVGIIDDPIKSADEASSPAILEKTWTWATSTFYSRIMHPGGILLVAQRWNDDDLIGRFEARMNEELETIDRLRKEADELERRGEMAEAVRNRRDANEIDSSMDRWDIIRYEALASTDQYLTEEGEIVNLQKGMVVDESWKLLREEGESLHPDRFPRSYYLRLKRLQPILFSAMYQQSPITEDGAYFTPSDFIRYDRGSQPKDMLMYCAWDLAISTKTSADYTAGVCAGIDHFGNMWFVDHVHGRFPDVRQTADLIIDMHTRNRAIITGVEHTVILQALEPILKQRMAERKEYIVLTQGKEKLIPVSDKQTRARTLQGLCRGGKVFVPSDLAWDGWVAEWTNFGKKGGHDDRTDAAAWCAILALRNAPPKEGEAEEEKKPMSMWDKLFKGLIGKVEDNTYMSS